MTVDLAVLDLTERVCRRIQVLTGRSNVWLAVQITNLSIVMYFVWAWAYFLASDVLTRGVIAVFCAGLLYVLTQTIFRVSIESAESSAYRRVARGARNSRRLRDAPLRIVFLTLSVFTLGPALLVTFTLHLYVALLSYSLIALTTVLLYVMACDPLPPTPGKLRAWLGALSIRRGLDRLEGETAKRRMHGEVRDGGRAAARVGRGGARADTGERTVHAKHHSVGR